MVGLAAVLCGLAGDAWSQTVNPITTDACSGCRINLEPVTVISDRGTGAGFGDIINMSGGPNGWIYAVSQLVPWQVSVFDESGRFQTTLGSKGRGPGEFQYLRSPIVDRRGRIHLTDVATQRRAVFSAELRFETEHPWPPFFQYDAVMIAPDTLFAAGSLRTPQSAGFPYHIIGNSGVIRSVGEAPAVFRADRSNMLARYLASEPQSGEIVSVTKYGQDDAYQIDVVDGDGRILRSWRRSAPGFGNERAGAENIAFEPPAPRVTGTWLDENGLLWVLILTADANYSPLPRSRAAGSEMRVALTSEDRDRIWDSILEVVDLQRGRLLARRRLHQYFFNVNGRNLVFHYQEGEDGQPTFPVLKPILHSPSQEAHRERSGPRNHVAARHDAS